jgi:methionine-rich copper-binding protein CopC
MIGRGSNRALPHRGIPTRAASILAALLLVVAVAAPALAHSELDTADPEDGAILDTPPTVVTLTFTEGLDASKSSIRVLGPDGATEVAEARPARDGARRITADDLVLAPGEYVVRWTAAAEDGHIERGRVTFTVVEPTPAPATPSPTPSPTGTAAASPSATPSPTPTPPVETPAPSPSPVPGDQSPAASSTDVLLPIVAALALVGVVGFLVLRRNRTA